MGGEIGEEPLPPFDFSRTPPLSQELPDCA
jgi:hypothetical protein